MKINTSNDINLVRSLSFWRKFFKFWLHCTDIINAKIDTYKKVKKEKFVDYISWVWENPESYNTSITPNNNNDNDTNAQRLTHIIYRGTLWTYFVSYVKITIK